jgi:hypothetical protein
MDSSSPEAREHLLQALDDEIKGLQEATRASKYRRNALAPVSRLPPEVLTKTFSILSSSTGDEEVGYMAWLRVTHVCHNWRETALNSPHLWSHINFDGLTPAGITEIPARAKTAPLRLEATAVKRNKAQLDAIERQLKAHISHTHHLSLSGPFQTVLQRLVSPAPALKSLSLWNMPYSYGWPPHLLIPRTLFNRAAPKLMSLELVGCDVSWMWPPLKGLKILEIRRPSRMGRPNLDIWLDALNEMPQLKMLTLESASPRNTLGNRRISETRRTVTLPSLTLFDITASAEECTLALAHLILPALTLLEVCAEYHDREGNDVVLLIPHVARNAYGSQDTAPLQSISMRGGMAHIEMSAWAVPGADVEDCDSISMHHSPRVWFVATAADTAWRRYKSEPRILDALLVHLPTNAISALTVGEHTRLDKKFWKSHVSSLAMVKRVCLFPAAVRAFSETLAEGPPPNGLRFPSLTKLTLVNVPLTALGTYRLHDMLRKRAEQGATLETLDLRTCIAAERAIQLLTEIVRDVQGPEKTLETGDTSFFNWKGGVDFFDEEEILVEDDDYEFGPDSLYGGTDDGEDEDEDMDEEGKEDDEDDESEDDEDHNPFSESVRT